MEMVLIFTFCLIVAGTDAVTTVTGYRGSVQIKCNYTSRYEKNNKYLCRGKCPHVGYRDVPVQSGSPAKDSRFSLYDDTTAKVFTVTITDLRPEDGGTYWCGIKQTGPDKYTEMLLLLKPAKLLNDANHPTPAPSSQEISVSSIVPAVSVVLVLLLIVLLITVTIQWKKKTQGSETVTQSPRETNEDYENDQNFLPVALSESVYQSLNPATNRSDSVYQSLNLTNNQSDLVYHTLTVTSNN